MGPDANRQTDVELGRGQHSVPTGPVDWFLHYPNTLTAPRDIAGRDEFCCPGTVPRRKGDATHCRSLGKAELGLPVRLTIVFSCGKLVAGVKVFLVVQLLKNVVALCRKPFGTDLTWCSRPP